MATTRSAKATEKRRRVPPPQTRAADVIVSVRLDAETLKQLDEIAVETERTRAAVMARALREYATREYDLLCDLRESDKDFEQGRWVSHDEAQTWIKDRRKGGKREPKYGQ